MEETGWISVAGQAASPPCDDDQLGCHRQQVHGYATAM
jgi:hypothetical protein